MAKMADRYFITDSWRVIEEGFDADYGQVAESIFSLGNEYMGVRGYFEEGYSGQSLIGSYFNGIYEEQKQNASAYKGMVNKTEFMVNAVNWLYTRMMLDGEILDLNKSSFQDFRRVLNLKNGVLTRSFIWKTSGGKMLKLEFERFVSMGYNHVGAQKITMTPLNFSGDLILYSGLDFTQMHHSLKKNFWKCSNLTSEENYLSLVGTTKHTKQKIFSSCRFFGDMSVQNDMLDQEKIAAKCFTFQLKENETKELTKIVSHVVYKNTAQSEEQLFIRACEEAEERGKAHDFNTLKHKNSQWWHKVWEHSDIVISGDELNQQGIRFCVFQMFQTYNGAEQGNNIGAKGLTGEAYNGNAFWDTEVYCLPFFMFNHLKAAENLLVFRHATLPQAKERAESLDCEGAFYPIATISGEECCNLWQHASLQLQASTGVAYGIWFYEKMTGSQPFLIAYGLPMLIEISRMMATRGSWSADGMKYGYYAVMGPDEFQMMVNHNCYTNYMGRFTLNYTLKVLEHLKKENPEIYEEIVNHMNIKQGECQQWAKMAENMYIPYDNQEEIYEQHEGYFKLPHIDVGAIPVEDFPLYHHWSYDRIYRNDMIKQPDVLMFMLMFNSNFTEEVIRKNYEYYEPKCIHESSLSPSVHSILASQLKKHEEAYEFFKFATRMDLDNYNRNTHEGLHITSLAAAWMNIIYGFGGMRSDGGRLSFAPSIPKAWEGYAFRINYQDNIILVDVNKETVSFRVTKEAPISIDVYGKTMQLSEEAKVVAIPCEWRG
jgi:maltose phosphorylase